MPELHPFFDHQVFSDTLVRCDLTDKVYDSHTISGLVLAILSAPEVIPPFEWFPLVFIDDGYSDEDEDPHEFEDAEQADDFYGQLLMLWNDWAAQLTIDEPLPLPAEYGLDSQGRPTPAFQAFCSGVIMGYGWLEETWNDLLDGVRSSAPEVDDVFGSTLAACLLIHDPEGTNRTMLEQAVPLEEQMSLQAAVELLPVGLRLLAAIGRDVVEALADESGPFQNPFRDVGRNDPCPCGSGKKFKHCCLH